MIMNCKLCCWNNESTKLQNPRRLTRDCVICARKHYTRIKYVIILCDFTCCHVKNQELAISTVSSYVFFNCGGLLVRFRSSGPQSNVAVYLISVRWCTLRRQCLPWIVERGVEVRKCWYIFQTSLFSEICKSETEIVSFKACWYPILIWSTMARVEWEHTYTLTHEQSTVTLWHMHRGLIK